MDKNLEATEIIRLIQEAWNTSKEHAGNEARTLIDDLGEQHPFFVERRIRSTAPAKEIIKAVALATTPEMQGHLIYILGKRRARTAAAAIIPFLENDDPYLRYTAADALAAIGAPKTGEVLMQHFVNETNSGVRAMLALALGAAGYRPAIPALIESLGDPNEWLRGFSSRALARLKASEAYEPMRIALARETDSATKERIQQSLAEIEIPPIEAPSQP